MKRTLLIIILSLLCSIAGAQDKTTKVVTDSVTFLASDVKVFEGITKNGNPKWWIELPADGKTKKVSLSESHVTSGRLLALIERKDTTTGRYSYSVKFAEPKKKSAGRADLSVLK